MIDPKRRAGQGSGQWRVPATLQDAGPFFNRLRVERDRSVRQPADAAETLCAAFRDVLGLVAPSQMALVTTGVPPSGSEANSWQAFRRRFSGRGVCASGQ